MKIVFLLLTGFVFPTFIYAQSDTLKTKFPPDPPQPPSVNEAKIYNLVEQMPEYPGGDVALIGFLKKHIKYPKTEKDNNIQGKVVVKFIIDEEGKISQVHVAKSVSPGLDKEAVRVVSLLHRFTPGHQQGKAVKVYFNLPIVFRLQNVEN